MQNRDRLLAVAAVVSLVIGSAIYQAMGGQPGFVGYFVAGMIVFAVIVGIPMLIWAAFRGVGAGARGLSREIALGKEEAKLAAERSQQEVAERSQQEVAGRSQQEDGQLRRALEEVDELRAKLASMERGPSVEQKSSGNAVEAASGAEPLAPKSRRARSMIVLVVTFVAMAGLFAYFAMTGSQDRSPELEARATAPPPAPAEAANVAAAENRRADLAAEPVPHHSALLGKPAVAAEAWCAAQSGKWKGEWGGQGWRRCEYDRGWLTGRADDAQSTLTGVMLHRPMGERERQELLSELRTKHGAPGEFQETNSGFVQARWQLPNGTTLTYRELGPHGASVTWELNR